MAFKRKKVSTLKKIISDIAIILFVLIVGVVYVAGAPERWNMVLFNVLDTLKLGRVGGALIWVLFSFIIGAIVTPITLKESKWNNKNLALPVISLNGDKIEINNYNNSVVLCVTDIAKVTIMNKDSVIQIYNKDGKRTIPENLDSPRLSYEKLKEYLTAVSPDITFEDSAKQ